MGVIGNERAKLQVAHANLSYSRVFIVRANLLRTHEMMFDAHNHAIRVSGGDPRRGIYDNMRTTNDKVGRRKDRDVNVCFMAMASHCRYLPEFCNPASSWEKGQTQKSVQMRVIDCGSPCRAFPRSKPYAIGWSFDAKSFGGDR